MNEIPGFEHARFAAMRGTFKENADYCGKAGLLTHFGEPFIGKGGRTDRNEIFAIMKAGASRLEMMESDFSGYCRFRQGINDYKSIVSPPRRKEPLEIYLFFGEPGTGKTETATAQLGFDYYRMPISDKLWFTPRFEGKTQILLDEFRANTKLHLLLQLLDKNPLEVENKGGFIWWQPECIIITTNKSPWTWFNYNARDFERRALFRRFKAVYRFDKTEDEKPAPYLIDINDQQAFSYPDPDEVPLHGQGHMMF